MQARNGSEERVHGGYLDMVLDRQQHNGYWSIVWMQKLVNNHRGCKFLVQ